MARRFSLLIGTALAGCGLSIVGDPPRGDPSPVGPPRDGGSAEIAIEDRSIGPDRVDEDQDAALDTDAPEAGCSCGPRALCLDGGCAAAYRIFVSSTSSTANIGGVDGADVRCQTLADAAGLGGTWKAWLSTSGSSPHLRFTKGALPYRLVTGTLIAASWGDLVNGTIAAPIDRDEKGVEVVAKEVWTATAVNGTYANAGTCQDFGSASPVLTTIVGGTQYADAGWTRIYDQYCNRTDPRLYCFEQ